MEKKKKKTVTRADDSKSVFRLIFLLGYTWV